MPEAKKGKGLHAKIAEIMLTVEAIEKKGFNEHFKYTFAREADVKDALRKEMAKRGIVMYPKVTNHSIREVQGRNGKQYIGTLDMIYVLIDSESGETFEIPVVGEGQDAGDKIFYKAMAGAMKYALTQTFMIPTFDDPEQEAKHENEPVPPHDKPQPKPNQNNRNRGQAQPEPKPDKPAPNKPDPQKNAENQYKQLVKSKWIELNGSEDGLIEWVNKKLGEGKDWKFLNAVLTKIMKEREEQGAQA